MCVCVCVCVMSWGYLVDNCMTLIGSFVYVFIYVYNYTLLQTLVMNKKQYITKPPLPFTNVEFFIGLTREALRLEAALW